MQVVLLTALGVGGATVFGALIGFFTKGMSHKFSDWILALAAGVMLSAAVIGLVIPSMDYGNILITVTGIFTGALFLNLADRFIPHLHNFTGKEEAHPQGNNRINKVLLFVLAIAIHNFPEGIAAGVGFGSGDTARALSVALGIALQNIPEGMVIIAPMLTSGISAKRTFFIASLTGVVEVVGTFIGYFAASISQAVLPFALAFAGGTMIYVISDEMIPETHHGDESHTTYALLAGFCLMLVMDYYIG